MKRVLISGIFLLGLGACAVPEPAVSSYNGDSVTVQVHSNITLLPVEEQQATYAKMQNQANYICSKGHKKRAEYTSTRTVPVNQYESYQERLYLCLN